MILPVGLTLLYLLLLWLLVHAIRKNLLGFADPKVTFKQHPLKYLLAYAIALLLIALFCGHACRSWIEYVTVARINAAWEEHGNQPMKPLHADLPKVTAHRGLAWQYPENTRISFAAAIEHKPDYVELDFRTTADGHLVCMHDGQLDRYLKDQKQHLKGKPIESMTLKVLENIDMGSWKSSRFAKTPIATLKQVIALFNQPGMPILMLEHKSGSVDQLLTELAAFRDSSQYVIQSFDWDFLKRLHRQNLSIRMAAISGGQMNDTIIPQVKAIGCYAVHWNGQITRKNVFALHHVGLEAWCYTFNHPRQWDHAMELGLDAITTDRCDVLRDYVAQARMSESTR